MVAQYKKEKAKGQATRTTRNKLYIKRKKTMRFHLDI